MNALVVVFCVIVSSLMFLKCNQTLLPPTLHMSTSVFLFDGFRFCWMYCSLTLATCIWSSPSSGILLSSSDFLLRGFSVSWMPRFMWPSASFTSSCCHPRHLLSSVFNLSLMASVPLDYRSLTLSTLWSSASSVEIVIMFLPVSHCWTLELYFLLTSIFLVHAAVV